MTSYNVEFEDLTGYEEAARKADMEAWERRHDTADVPAAERYGNVSVRDMATALIAHQNATYRVSTTFGKIQQGDIVHRTTIHPDGSTVSVEGVALSRREHDSGHDGITWHSDYVQVASVDDDMRDDIVLQRIPRSKVLYS